MNLPKLTNQQQAIIRLLYRYRFLDRTQIQALMQHKDKRRIMAWLKDLRDKQYITWIYDGTNFAEKTKPAIYYLSLNGVRFLRTLGDYPAAELRKRYKEASRQQDFIARCLLLATCAINLQARSAEREDVTYTSITQADYADPEHSYHFLSELGPHLYFRKQASTTKRKDTTNYLLEVFDQTMPRYMVKKRLKDYVTYLDDGDWESETGDDMPPIVLLVCPTTAELIYAKRRIRRLLEDVSDEETIHLRLATIEQLKQSGVTGKIWEEV